MIIDICILLIALITAFLTASYGYILFYQRKTESSWRALRKLYKAKFALCTEILTIVNMTYPCGSETIKKLAEKFSKCIRAVTPDEYTASDRNFSLEFMAMEKLAEKYPLLYETEKYAALKDSLIAADEKIAFARQFCNKEIDGYNTKLFKMPFRIVSSICNFKKKDEV